MRGRELAIANLEGMHVTVPEHEHGRERAHLIGRQKNMHACAYVVAVILCMDMRDECNAMVAEGVRIWRVASLENKKKEKTALYEEPRTCMARHRLSLAEVVQSTWRCEALAGRIGMAKCLVSKSLCCRAKQTLTLMFQIGYPPH